MANGYLLSNNIEYLIYTYIRKRHTRTHEQIQNLRYPRSGKFIHNSIKVIITAMAKLIETRLNEPNDKQESYNCGQASPAITLIMNILYMNKR